MYVWVTSLPNEAVPPAPDGAIRAESFMCMERYGFCKDLPNDRTQRKGVYFRSLGFLDFKVPWLVVRMGRPFLYSGMTKFQSKVNAYITENYDKVKKESNDSPLRNW